MFFASAADPHPYGEAESKYFATLLTLSPAGDELTRELAEAVLVNEGLGLFGPLTTPAATQEAGQPASRRVVVF